MAEDENLVDDRLTVSRLYSGAKRRVRMARNRISDLTQRSNVGKWDEHYARLDEEELYGDETTYRMAADYLEDCALVEDWGCGSGGFRKFRREGYVGVDGSKSPFADKIVDLEKYRSSPPGILMRHILEHNYRWEPVLDNALRSFTQRMCLIIFTPFTETTTEIAYNHDYGVPDIAFARADLVSRFGDIPWTSKEDISTDTMYGVEHVFFLSKEKLEAAA